MHIREMSRMVRRGTGVVNGYLEEGYQGRLEVGGIESLDNAYGLSWGLMYRI